MRAFTKHEETFGVLHRVMLNVYINVSEKRATSFFRVEV